ncbi:MAG: hypothetical protein WD232_08510 [Acidimicrobiales bacterium]
MDEGHGVIGEQCVAASGQGEWESMSALGEQAQLFELVGPEEVGFVDHHDHGLAPFSFTFLGRGLSRARAR